MDLTRNELQFMTVFWCVNTPLTSTEILKRSVDKNWRDASLHTILNKLLEKGALAEHGFIKDGKSIARTFIPVLTCEEYYETLFAGHTTAEIPMILSALMRREDLNTETIDKLEKIIRDRRVSAEK
jgi:predicted transcriptional regulator